jgi:DNA cross-link repair 1A protein
MASYRALQGVRIGTLILDTTYCDPQYDFPKQDTVVQFVIDAIQAETFNPKTLFLIGSYTIGELLGLSSERCD